MHVAFKNLICSTCTSCP